MKGILLCCLGLLISITTIASEVVTISAPQMKQYQRKTNECYQILEKVKAKSVEEDSLLRSKLSVAFMDEDAEYTQYRTANNTICVELENLGANDMAWSLGAKRVKGCECKIEVDSI